MHSIKIVKFGGPEVMQFLEETPVTQLAADSVRIDVKAAGVNFADIMMRMGLYPEAPKPPFVPGYELAGIVKEVGSAVKHVKPGDRVVAGTKFGGYTTHIVLPQSQVRPVPQKLSFEEAASIPVNFITAGVALREMARVREADRVVIYSAAGGVGVAAVQMAAQAGAHVIGLVSSKQKEKAVLDLGAKEVWTYDEWDAASPQKLGRIDIILDPVGGKTLKQSYARLSSSGRVVTFGASSAIGGATRSLKHLAQFFLQTSFFTPFKLMDHNRGVFGLNALQLYGDPLMDKVLNEVMQDFEQGRFKVIVGKTFSMTQAGQAHSYLQGRSNVGKVILTN